jgi:hypothetical protein
MVFIRNIVILLFALFMTFLTFKLAILSVYFVHILPENLKIMGKYIFFFYAIYFLITMKVRYLKKKHKKKY